MTEEQKELSGLMFCPGDPALGAIKAKAHRLSKDFNNLYESEGEKRREILKELLGAIGENTGLTGPIMFHYGVHTRIGSRTFINFNFTCQDDGPVTIGDDCNFGPNCTIVTPLHPMVASERNRMKDANGKDIRLCYAKPVVIGNSCWLGANVVVLPGVTIGDRCVIGAGSVVTRDIPADSFAAGVPARVIRTITEKDSMKYKPEVLGEYSVADDETN